MEYFALKTFIATIANKHVNLKVDNTTVVACINAEWALAILRLLIILLKLFGHYALTTIFG